MKAKNTKRALLMSALCLLLCISMLVSTTYAWFTDSVTSAGNKIVAGNLEVDLIMWNGTKYVSIADEDAAIFGAGSLAQNNAAETLWEPGKTQIVYLGVENKGNLDMKYNILLNVIDGGLIGSLEYAVVDGATNATALPANWAELKAAAQTGDIAAGTTLAAPSGAIKAGDEAVDYFALAVHMKEEAGNEYQNKDITIDVTVMATQLASEEDSFGSDYDENAYNTYVYTAGQLRSALEQGGDVVVDGNINPEDTIVASEWGSSAMEFYVDAGEVDTLTGGTYVLDASAKYGIVVAAVEGQSVTLSDMDITADSRWSVTLDNYGEDIVVENVTINATSGAGLWAYGSDSVTTLNNVTINQEGLSEANASTAWANTAVAVSNGQTLVINGGSYTGQTWAVYGYNSGSNITINGGTFKGERVIQLDGVWSGSATSVATINGGNFDGQIYLDWGTNAPELYINGGNFTNFSATVNGQAKLVIKGGTFDADPSAYVADGYTAIANADGTYTVIKGVAVSDNEELTNVISDGGTIVLSTGSYTMPVGSSVNLQGKSITITGTKDTIIDMSRVDARDQFVIGANIVFDGVTLNFGTSNYMGLANTASLTYKNCQINGLQFLYCADVSFENCDFNSNGAEHSVWTYGAQRVSFTGCDFTYGDRGINCYSDNDVTGGKQTVNFTDCTFTTTNAASKGAVEINSCYFSVGIEVNMDGCTAPAYGEMAYVSEWDSTNGANTTINIK